MFQLFPLPILSLIFRRLLMVYYFQPAHFQGKNHLKRVERLLLFLVLRRMEEERFALLREVIFRHSCKKEISKINCDDYGLLDEIVRKMFCGL